MTEAQVIRMAELIYQAEGFTDLLLAGSLPPPASWVEQELTASHTGDCMKQPWSCMRCHAEEYVAIARYVASGLFPHDLPNRTIDQIERDLAAARQRYRRNGPRHEHAEECERLYAELQQAKGIRQ